MIHRIATPRAGGPAYDRHRKLPDGWCGDVVNASTGEVRQAEVLTGGLYRKKQVRQLKVSAPGCGVLYVNLPTTIWFPLAKGETVSKPPDEPPDMASVPSPDPKKTKTKKTGSKPPRPGQPAHAVRLKIIERLWCSLNRARNELTDLKLLTKQKGAQVDQIESVFAQYMSDETPPLFDEAGNVVLEAQSD